MTINPGKAKKTKANAKRAVPRDLKPTGADATKGGSLPVNRVSGPMPIPRRLVSDCRCRAPCGRA
jgi:hypothetical protein